MGISLIDGARRDRQRGRDSQTEYDSVGSRRDMVHSEGVQENDHSQGYDGRDDRGEQNE